MNKKNKFRGRTLNGGQWVYGSLLQDDYGNCCIVEFADHHEQWHDVEPNSVGQFTGLLDKNGKEIYEGDIVIYDDTPYCPSGNKYKGEVVVFCGAWCVKYYEAWCDEYFYSALFSDNFANRKTVIIGNIHDNPKLLKGGKQ